MLDLKRTSLVLAAVLSAAPVLASSGNPVYRCPGNLYTDALSAKEAIAKGCKTLEGAPITVIQGPARTATQGTGAGASGAASGEKVAADEQKARDADRRVILEAELRKEEESLAALKKEFNNGEPERQGNERNYQKYQERVDE